MAELEVSLRAALADLTAWLENENIPAVIVGGIAASVLGRPRLTRDIDALVLLPEEAWSRAMESAAKHGIVPRIRDALGFARRSRVLLMRHTHSAIDLDIILGGLPFEQSAIERATMHTIAGLSVPPGWQTCSASSTSFSRNGERNPRSALTTTSAWPECRKSTAATAAS
jgi:hypothetical protein